MPSIPQSAFDINPSTRVGGQQAVNIPSAEGKAINAVADLTGAVALLQDQSERTEAFAKANEIKRAYLNEKVQYEAALQSADTNGNYSYIDPMDNNPEVDKRKRNTGKLSERFQALKDIHDKGMNEVQGLTRGDLGSDLLQQYVGEDMIQTQLRTNKIMIRKKEKEVLESASENMQLKINSIMDAFSADTPNPEMTRLKVAQIGNSIDRELAAAAPIIGSENTANLARLRDRSYSSAATQLVRENLNASTVNAAEQMVARIRNPVQRQLASSQLEREKRSSLMSSQLTMFKKGQDLISNITSAPVIDDITYMKAVQTSKQLANMYVDPKYSEITGDQANTAAIDVLSAALAKRTFQNNLTQNMEFLDSMSKTQRGPGVSQPQDGSALPPGSAQLVADLEREIDQSGMTAGFVADIKQQLRDQTLTKMRDMRMSLGSDLPDYVAGVYKGAPGPERIAKIKLIADEQGLGYTPLLTRKEVTGFKKNFNEALQQGSTQALEVFEGLMAIAGDSQTGKESYRRAMAQDIASNTPQLSYLVPLSDVHGGIKVRMLDNASKYMQNLEDFDLTDEKLDDSFSKFGIGRFDSFRGTNVYSGLKQAIYHEAAAQYKDTKNLDNAMKRSVEAFSSVYTAIGDTRGKAQVMMLNTPGGVDFNRQKDTLKAGVNKALTMPHLDYEEKARLLERLVPQAGIRGADGKVKASQAMIDTTLKALVSIEPEARYPNVHRYSVNGVPLLDSDGNIIELTADDFLSYGQEATNKQLTESQRLRPQEK